MTVEHVLDVVMRAGVWRAMHGVSPLAAAVAGACIVLALVARRRWRGRR